GRKVEPIHSILNSIVEPIEKVKKDYDLIVIKTLERVSKNYYYIIRGNYGLYIINRNSKKLLWE
ncbi:MAG: hypothetical protein K6F30_05430, partial [Lachnospiraceae bacterium]|nr:hypothetical protein [Lachnospiraceae bacterium]